MADRWHHAEDLYHAALERPANQRAAFLLEATGGNDALRQEVESLLSRQSEAESFIGSPASEISNREPGPERTPSADSRPAQAGGGIAGKTISHYRVIEELGAGGMGVVYRAHDMRLDRDVALKVLPAGRLAGEAARNRFHKEALALAKLNHPHIGAIYDFDTQEVVDFLVMEYIQGTTLGEQLASGPLPESEVLRLGTQIVAALEEAHEQGIVHRDLKPGNIVVTPKGQAKVLDFGLAKLLRPASELSTADDLSSTALGAGTLPYMARSNSEACQQMRARTFTQRGRCSTRWRPGGVPFGANSRRRWRRTFRLKHPRRHASSTPKFHWGWKKSF